MSAKATLTDALLGSGTLYGNALLINTPRSSEVLVLM